MKAEDLTPKRAEEVMKERGYSRTATNGDKTVLFFMKVIPLLGEESMHAQVTLKSQSVTLSFVNLKYFCELRAHRFDFWHPDFEKYEQILASYIGKCLEIDVFEILKEFKDSLQPKSVPKKDIKERKREFWDKIVAVGKDKGYEKEMCVEFKDYWCEMNEGGRKMRFEMEDVFDIKRRLNTWLQNDKKWLPAWKAKEEKKIKAQDKEKEVSKTASTKALFG